MLLCKEAVQNGVSLTAISFHSAVSEAAKVSINTLHVIRQTSYVLSHGVLAYPRIGVSALTLSAVSLKQSEAHPGQISFPIHTFHKTQNSKRVKFNVVCERVNSLTGGPSLCLRATADPTVLII